MAVEALDPIEKRETKERIQNAIKQEPTPEEQEADLVSQLASQYANTPLYPTA